VSKIKKAGTIAGSGFASMAVTAASGSKRQVI